MSGEKGVKNLEHLTEICQSIFYNPRSHHTKDFKNGTWYLLA